MSSPAAQLHWYLAREGQQYGPLSDVELAKFIELGHLQPNDLLWREGFPDWRPALVVFPPRKGPTPRSPAARYPAPPDPMGQPGLQRHGGTGARSGPAGMRPSQARHAQPAEMEEPPRRGGRFKRFLVMLIFLGALGGGGLYAYQQRKVVMEQIKTLPSRLSSAFGDGAASNRGNLEASPLKGFRGSPEAVDAALQATPLWRIIKRDYPDWYDARLKEAVSLAAQNKDEPAIAQHMARALVTLRRQNAKFALAAGFPQLKAVASSFYENLSRLRKQSPEACFEFISQGEASPTVISLMQNPAHAAYLQAQLTDVFEAIADGRKSGRAYPQPRKTDYDTLASDLSRMGWSQADLQLFSDERALSAAGPAKVCQLVHDWFAAQLGLKDPDMQLRLLVDSLKPVVAG